MPRKKAKPTRIVKLDYGSAHTEKARYATREDRHFSFNLGGADDFRDGAFYLVGVIDGHRGAACAEEVARFLPSKIGGGSSFRDAFARMEDVHGTKARRLLLRGHRQGRAAGRRAADAGRRVAGRLPGVRGAPERRRRAPDCGPLSRQERERIEAAGGMLVDDDGCVRVGVRPDDDAKTVDLLAACRAFGTPTSSGPSPWSSRRRT